MRARSLMEVHPEPHFKMVYSPLQRKLNRLDELPQVRNCASNLLRWWCSVRSSTEQIA